MSKTLAWIAIAITFLGLKENTSKTAHNPTIIKWLGKMGSFNGEARSWWKNDEEAWCGLFVGFVLGSAGRYVVKEWYRAKEWNDKSMTKLSRPAVGAVAVFKLQSGYHVAFIVGKTKTGRIVVIGGNQSNSVSYTSFDPSNMVGCYWPSRVGRNNEAIKSVPLEDRFILPIMESNGTASTR